jgi:hypothetical protein
MDGTLLCPLLRFQAQSPKECFSDFRLDIETRSGASRKLFLCFLTLRSVTEDGSVDFLWNGFSSRLTLVSVKPRMKRVIYIGGKIRYLRTQIS